MVETFTPAVCGSRRRQWLALTGFALGAVGVSALVGALLGAIGAALGAQLSLVAAGLALVAAAREAGLVSFPLPQLRRQVPERWRFELPLPVWSVGYGAGLGAGFLTYQPVATFWVACAASAQGIGAGFDPSARGTVFGRAQMDSGTRRVVVEPPNASSVVVPGAWSPSVDGSLLAYVDGGGIKVIDWSTRAPVAQVDGAVSRPALDWPLLAFVRTDATYKRLILADFTNPGAPTMRQITKIVRRNDLGRPSLASGRLAWHKVTAVGSQVYLQVLASGKRRVIARSKVAVLANPSLSATRIVWVKQFPRSCALLTRRFDSRTVKRIYRTTKKTRLLWTTALTGRTAYVTQWSQKTRAS